MIIGSNLANFFAYIYHVVFGRIFEPSQYGELAAAFSITGMIASALTFLGLVIVKFVSATESMEEKQKLLSWFLRKGIILGGILCFLFLLFTPQLSNFLHVQENLVYLIGPIIFVSLLSLMFKSFLQGLIKFNENIITTNVEMIGKLLFGLLFVYIGFSVFGAMLGLLCSTILGVFLGKRFLKGYRFTLKSSEAIDTKKVVSYSLPIFISSIATNSLLLMDLVLVKHFFPSSDAGIYASVATLGKIIFFGTAPVASVMFPIVSKKHAKGETYVKVFLLSLLLTFIIAVGVIALFLIIPELIVHSVYGNKYTDAGGYLFYYGIFILLFTLASLILNFYLSIGKTKLISIVVLSALAQIIGIWFYHDSLQSTITVSILCSLFFFGSLALYFLKEAHYEHVHKRIYAKK
jgi:O-antigen/teichoic acid export membrane protein